MIIISEASSFGLLGIAYNWPCLLLDWVSIHNLYYLSMVYLLNPGDYHHDLIHHSLLEVTLFDQLCTLNWRHNNPTLRILMEKLTNKPTLITCPRHPALFRISYRSRTTTPTQWFWLNTPLCMNISLTSRTTIIGLNLIWYLKLCLNWSTRLTLICYRGYLLLDPQHMNYKLLWIPL